MDFESKSNPMDMELLSHIIQKISAVIDVHHFDLAIFSEKFGDNVIMIIIIIMMVKWW